MAESPDTPAADPAGSSGRSDVVAQRLRLARMVVLAAAVVILVVGATFLRQQAIPKWRTVWAEDGLIFGQCAYDQGPIACLVTPYQGYLHTVPRLAAEVVPIGNPATMGLRLTAAAAGVAALAALVLALAVEGLTGSAIAGLMGAAALVLVYQAGREISGNLTNLHWILLAAASAVLLTTWSGRRSSIADMVLVAATALTSAMAPVLVALALVSVALRVPRARVMAAVTVVATAPQVLAMLLSQRVSPGHDTVTIGMLLDSFRMYVVDSAWFGPGQVAWNNLVLPILGAAIAALALALALEPAGGRSRAARLRLLAVPVLTAATGLAVFVVAIVVNHGFYYRYQYEPSALSLIALAITVGLLARELGRLLPRLGATWGLTARVIPVGLLLAVVLVGGLAFGQGFRLQARASTGPNTLAAVDAGAAACARGAASVRVLVSPSEDPKTWHIDVPCAAVRR